MVHFVFLLRALLRDFKILKLKMDRNTAGCKLSVVFVLTILCRSLLGVYQERLSKRGMLEQNQD